MQHPFITILFFSLALSSCQGQSSRPASGNTTRVGGACETCEFMFIGMPENIHSTDTSSGWKEKGQPLIISGIAYKKDGVTPAPGIIIYYWQTDHTGLYSPAPGMDPRTKRHGHIRGWMKTDKDGRYTLYTIRPAPYPKESMPAHIHLAIKEPDISNEYYIDELLFDDDPFLTAEKRAKLENRGGTGILKTEMANGRQHARHKIIAGLNIPGYP